MNGEEEESLLPPRRMTPAAIRNLQTQGRIGRLEREVQALRAECEALRRQIGDGGDCYVLEPREDR